MPRSSFRFEAIGTYFEIVTAEAIGLGIRKSILATTEGFDKEFSRFREDSTVTKMKKSAGEFAFSKDSAKLFDLYDDLYKLSEGKVNPLVGESLEALGYDAKYSLRKQSIQPAPAYEAILSRNGSTLQTARPLTFDVGAAGKGYLVDEIAAILDSSSISEYVIDASGDVLHKGNDVEVVGLEDPLNNGKVIGEFNLKNRALCASAINRRVWGEGLHHIVDPTTGEPTNDVIATWVVADSTMLADGLATTLFFVNPELIKASYNYEYIRVRANGKIDFSEGFKDTLY